MTGKGLVNGTEVEFNITMDCKDKKIEDLLQGKGNWLRFTYKGIDTVIELISCNTEYSMKAFDVRYKKYQLFNDETVSSELYDRNYITDEQEYDGFYQLSEAGILYPHINFKSPFNGICKELFGEGLFDPYTGVLITEVLA